MVVVGSSTSGGVHPPTTDRSVGSGIGEDGGRRQGFGWYTCLWCEGGGVERGDLRTTDKKKAG